MSKLFAIQPHYAPELSETPGMSLTSASHGNRQSIFRIEGNIGIINIDGILWNRCRGGYVEIAHALKTVLSDFRVKSVLLDVDSPGGEVAGAFDLADKIFESRNNSKPIIAIANERCFSAAYVLASGADRVYLSRTAQVGSIGVIALHVDQSGYDAKLGVKYSVIKAGGKKDDFFQHAPLGDTARQSAQKEVDKIYDLMCATVARNRHTQAAAIRNTQAALFMGQGAVANGLADGVKTYDEILTQLRKGNR